MKILFIIILGLIFTFSHTNAQQTNKITKEDAWMIVQKEILHNNRDSINVYVSDSVIAANSSIITIMGNDYSPSFDSWFFFIDDMPHGNWCHPCRYVYVNCNNGSYEIINKKIPPLLENLQLLLRHDVNVSNGGLLYWDKKEACKNQTTIYPNHEYAVIISAASCSDYNNVRFGNDCSAMYYTLINKYGYSKDHIYVLMGDGTDPAADLLLTDNTKISSPLDLDGDGISDIQYAATYDNIISVFESLDNTLSYEDNLFIFITGHGGQVNGEHVLISVWNNEYLHDYILAPYINNLNANTIKICMGQCNSGGFIDDITRNNVVISTACNFDEFSYSMPGNLYDEFVYHWISAVAGETPSATTVNADSNNDGIISLLEAFNYAETNDVRDETPQYLSRPTTLGELLDLKDSLIYCISGSTLLYNTGIYSILGPPSSYSFTWSLSGANASCYTLQSNTPTTNQCTITKKDSVDFVNTNNLVLNANIYYGSTLITTLTKPLTAVYINGPTVICSSYTYQVKNLPDNCTVSWSWSGTGVIIDNTPIIIEPYYSTNNYFSLSRSSINDYAKGTITANIQQNGNTIATITKTIDTGANFSGTWYQGTATATTLQCGQAYSISYGSQVVLQSSDFVGKTVTYTKNGLRLWGNTISHSGNTISFTPLTPVLNPNEIESGGNLILPNSITIKVTGSGTCECYEFTFSVPSVIPPLNNPSLNVGASGSEYTFSLKTDADDANGASGRLDQTWKLEIVQYETGQTICKMESDSPKTVNTSGWKPGIYIAVATIGENSLAQKLVIN